MIPFLLTAYLILSWLIAVVTVPELKNVLLHTSRTTVTQTVLLGFGWALGAITFGLGVDYLGLALGFAVTLGLSAAIGTLVPLVVLSPESLMSSQGALILLGVVIMLIGIEFQRCQIGEFLKGPFERP